MMPRPQLRLLPQVEILRQVWLHHYSTDEHGDLRWREGSALPPASLRFDSPYDVDAHWCVERGTEWSGYRVHLTETCDDDLPHLVVHVATTIAPVQDGQLTKQIHDDLATAGLTPAEHVVDAAYVSAARIQRADQVHQITLLGPIAPDPSAQAKAGAGFDKSAFVIDWDRQVAICPRGSPSRSWGLLRIKGHDYIQVRFDTATCRACPVRTSCTASADRPRALALLPRPLHEIQSRNRAEQAHPNWQARYAIRAGCESTISENVQVRGLRRTRYRGLAKTHVQHTLTAMACNLVRLGDWLSATPKTRRRASRFRTLCQTVLTST